jgi:carboxynorspermidine decarboxylase
MREYNWVGGLEMTQKHIEFAVQTPAFVYDEGAVLAAIENIRNLIGKNCHLFFPLKSFAILDALHAMAHSVDGFSVSSLFEAKLARTVLGNRKSVHITTPGFRPDDIPFIAELCDYISFNSLSQWERYNKEISSKASCGIRINPALAFIKDERYNPCRKGSKLGVPLCKLSEISNDGYKPLREVRGLHFHTNCESTDFDQLFQTVLHIEACLPRLLGQVDWVNLGGGYLFEEGQHFDKLIQAIALLRDKYDVKVFFEPGKAIVGSSGYIISSVIDMFQNDGQIIAILDTSVNHMPEVFEYGYRPDVMQESRNGKYIYTLAGATCLAGDLFGEYRFDEPLEIGSRITFLDMGSYTLVKAHMFNGVNLPTIYAYTMDGKLELKKQFDYEDYKSRWG